MLPDLQTADVSTDIHLTFRKLVFFKFNCPKQNKKKEPVKKVATNMLTLTALGEIQCFYKNEPEITSGTYIQTCTLLLSFLYATV